MGCQRARTPYAWEQVIYRVRGGSCAEASQGDAGGMVTQQLVENIHQAGLLAGVEGQSICQGQVQLQRHLSMEPACQLGALLEFILLSKCRNLRSSHSMPQERHKQQQASRLVPGHA